MEKSYTPQWVFLTVRRGVGVVGRQSRPTLLPAGVVQNHQQKKPKISGIMLVNLWGNRYSDTADEIKWL